MHTCNACPSAPCPFQPLPTVWTSLKTPLPFPAADDDVDPAADCATFARVLVVVFCRVRLGALLSPASTTEGGAHRERVRYGRGTSMYDVNDT